MTEVLGAVAACDQLAGSFKCLYKELRTAYKIMRHARKDIKEMKSRTKILERLWRFFGDTMEKVYKIKEFSVDLKRYRKIGKALRRQSRRVGRKIRSILSVLRPILGKEYTSAWTELRVRLEWLFRNREQLRLLHVDMDLLTRYMDIFSGLVQMRIAVQQYTLTGSAATKIQIDALGYKIDMALDGIRQVRKGQELLPASEDWQEQVRQEVQRALKREVALMKKAMANNDASSGSSSGVSPPVPSPSTPPTTPPSQPRSPVRARSIIEQPSRPVSPLPERTFPMNNRPSAVHVAFSPDSEVSYVSGHQGLTTNPAAGIHPPCTAADGEEAEAAESEDEGSGIYMPTALFGPPRPRRRVPHARVSTTSLNHDHRISSISPVSKPQEESRPRARDTSTSPQPRTRPL